MIQSATGLPLEDARSRKVSGVFVFGSELSMRSTELSQLLNKKLPTTELPTTRPELAIILTI
jgi:hypothetical protein